MFEHGYESTYDEMLSFYPLFYRDVLELKAILEADGRMLDEAIKQMNGVLANAFVQTADAATITRLERFLGISVDTSRELEERRSLVFSFFVGFGKISATKIREIIRGFTGADSAVTFNRTDEAGNSTLVIELERGDNPKLNYTDIDTVLARRIPAHIAYMFYVKHAHSVVADSRAVTTHHRVNYLLCGTVPAGIAY